jgi:hypothetical protein
MIEVYAPGAEITVIRDLVVPPTVPRYTWERARLYAAFMPNSRYCMTTHMRPGDAKHSFYTHAHGPNKTFGPGKLLEAITVQVSGIYGDEKTRWVVRHDVPTPVPWEELPWVRKKTNWAGEILGHNAVSDRDEYETYARWYAAAVDAVKASVGA